MRCFYRNHRSRTYFIIMQRLRNNYNYLHAIIHKREISPPPHFIQLRSKFGNFFITRDFTYRTTHIFQTKNFSISIALANIRKHKRDKNDTLYRIKNSCRHENRNFQVPCYHPACLAVENNSVGKRG